MRLDEKDIGEDIPLHKQADDGCQADLGLVVESHISCKSLLIDKPFRSLPDICGDTEPGNP